MFLTNSQTETTKYRVDDIIIQLMWIILKRADGIKSLDHLRVGATGNLLFSETLSRE